MIFQYDTLRRVLMRMRYYFIPRFFFLLSSWHVPRRILVLWFQQIKKMTYCQKKKEKITYLLQWGATVRSYVTLADESSPTTLPFVDMNEHHKITVSKRLFHRLQSSSPRTFFTLFTPLSCFKAVNDVSKRPFFFEDVSVCESAHESFLKRYAEKENHRARGEL